MSENRFDRNEHLFGNEGQTLLRTSVVAVVGVGGLGTHVVQQLALLGVGGLLLIDKEELAESNRNRYVGACHDDSVPGTPKVEIGRRVARCVDPDLRVEKIAQPFRSEAAFQAIEEATHVFGCLDSDGERLILNEVCCAFRRPYIDLASDVEREPTLHYGGRVCINWSGDGCVMCLDVLDQRAVAADLGGEEHRRNDGALYGVRRSVLGAAGPSVVSINGVVASLGVTEFMVGVTGLRRPEKLLTYYGEKGKVVVSKDQPEPDCWYCKAVWGAGKAADIYRYLRQL
jgi:hypothetical protein